MNKIARFFLRGTHYILRHISSWDAGVVSRLSAAASEKEAAAALLPPLQTDDFFRGIRLITHAGGGMSGLAYLNCLEAYEVYYAAGNRVFEYDVKQAADGTFVLAHEGDGASLIDERFHPMPLRECISHLREHTDTVVVFDCKFENLTSFAAAVYETLGDPSAIDRVVIQVFNAENISQVRGVGPFRMLYVCMMDTNYPEAANLCIENRIGAVSISHKALRERTGWDVFIKSNICMFAYTVNTISTYRQLRADGIWGVFSDYLTAKDIF